MVCNLPYCTRISLTVYKRPMKEGARLEDQPPPAGVLKERDVPVGWVNCLLTDHRGTLKSGSESLKLWPNARANPIGTCVENLAASQPPALWLEFESFFRPVAFPDAPAPYAELPKTLAMPKDQLFEKKIESLVANDPLTPLSADENLLMWHWRGYLISRPHALSKVLMACLAKPDFRQTHEMHRLIGFWQVAPTQALELLDAKFMDPVVRRYAVSRLEGMSMCACFYLHVCLFLSPCVLVSISMCACFYLHVCLRSR